MALSKILRVLEEVCFVHLAPSCLRDECHCYLKRSSLQNCREQSLQVDFSCNALRIYLWYCPTRGQSPVETIRGECEQMLWPVVIDGK